MFWRKQQRAAAAPADTTPTAAALAGGIATPAKSGVPRNLLFVVAVALLVVMVGAKFIDDLRKGTFGNDGEVKQRPREVPPSDNETGKIGSAARAGVESVKPKKDLTEEQVRAAIAAPTELSTQAAIDSSRSRIASPPENPGTSSPTPPIAETKKTLVIDPDAPTPSGLLTPAGRQRGVDSAGAGSEPVLRAPKGALPAPESGKGQPTRDLLKEEQEVFNVRSSPLLARGETVPTNPEGRSSSSTQAAPVGSAPEKPPTSGDPIDSYLSLLSRANPGPGGSGAGSETRASWLSGQRNAKPEGVVLSQPALGGDVVLPASVLNLVTRTTIRSDLDGDVIAVVTDDVRDTVKGKSIVIPKGSQVLGSVSSNLQPGQERAFTAFRTLYFPDGRSFELRGLTGSDSAGAAGLPADVDRHLFRKYGTGLLLGAIAYAVDRKSPTNQLVVVGGQTAQQTKSLTQYAGEVMAETTKSYIEGQRGVPDLLVVPAGTAFTVIVRAPLLLVPSSVSPRQ